MEDFCGGHDHPKGDVRGGPCLCSSPQGSRCPAQRLDLLQLPGQRREEESKEHKLATSFFMEKMLKKLRSTKLIELDVARFSVSYSIER